MARTALAIDDVALTGLELSDVLVPAVADGHYFSNSGDPILVVKNAGASPVNVTVQTPYTRDGLALADLVVAVAAGETIFIGPFPSNTFDQVGAARGQVYVDLATATDMTIGVIRP